MVLCSAGEACDDGMRKPCYNGHDVEATFRPTEGASETKPRNWEIALGCTAGTGFFRPVAGQRPTFLFLPRRPLRREPLGGCRCHSSAEEAITVSWDRRKRPKKVLPVVLFRARALRLGLIASSLGSKRHRLTDHRQGKSQAGRRVGNACSRSIFL